MKRILLDPKDPKLYKENGEHVPLEITPISTGSNDILLKTNVNVSQFSTKFAASLGFSDLVSGRMDSKHSFFLFEYAATSPQLQNSTTDGQNVNVAFGYSMRIGIVVKNDTISGNVNLSSLAAQATIKSAETLCQTQFYKIDRSILGDLGKQFDGMKSFDANQRQTIPVFFW